ncbi:hypothetical protein [Algoriphagus boritolerans]|uniref:Type 1 periplasmic binding fold superfamily protein n=1 Tax=Algoriphagus boritolerans DSM 17298 = JCM 18970 TaxID=1120964 RepID=A0A1H5Y670_9BACT|nr:hypothetical protein [Algoriphagus boritolerans]SEG19100.1 hypothetical protein SAMN03080598_02821 [Algoriphagus boritolerans DSM 17298 = JCM 18970]
MKDLRKLPIYLFGVLALGFASCESNDPEEENDGEVITEVTLNFQELDATGNPMGLVTSFKASDPEGIEVGSSPIIQPVTLTRGKTYRMTIAVYNGIEDEDITEEILAEADVHQFYFLGSAFTSNILSISYDDPSGDLIGLQNILSVSSSPGTNNTQMQVVLRHDLDKNFPGATNPNFANFVQAGGETDLDITFPVVIN